MSNRKRPSKRIGGPAAWTVNEILDRATSYELFEILEAVNRLIETPGPESAQYVKRQLVGEHYPDLPPDADLAKVNVIVQGHTAHQLVDLKEALDKIIETPGPERELSKKRSTVGRWGEDDSLLPGAPHWDARCKRWEIYPGDRWSS